jgi:hypothetical protein
MANVQARLGEFLGLKVRILAIQRGSSDPDLLAKAQAAYEQQLYAETQVTDALAALEEIKQEGPNVDRIARIGTASGLVEWQISEVNRLEALYRAERGDPDPINWGLWVNIALVGVGALWLLKR